MPDVLEVVVGILLFSPYLLPLAIGGFLSVARWRRRGMRRVALGTALLTSAFAGPFCAIVLIEYLGVAAESDLWAVAIFGSASILASLGLGLLFSVVYDLQNRVAQLVRENDGADPPTGTSIPKTTGSA